MSLIKMNAKAKSKVNTADSRNSKKKCNCPQNADSSADEPWKRADRGWSGLLRDVEQAVTAVVSAKRSQIQSSADKLMKGNVELVLDDESIVWRCEKAHEKKAEHWRQVWYAFWHERQPWEWWEWSLVQWLKVLILCGEDVGSNPAGKLFTPQKLSIHIPNPLLPPSLRRRRGRVPSEILQTFQ